jgi:hypothetical protein
VSDIVTLSELQDYLGGTFTSEDDELLSALLDNVEAMYERDTLHPAGFYQAADTGVTVVLNGTGSSYLYLPYAIDDITSISLGYDSGSPLESLDVASPSVVSYGVGERVVVRTDGGWFGSISQRRYVHVVYDHLGNVPEDAKLPIMEVVASLYRNSGSEGMKSETLGGFYSYTVDEAQAQAATNVNWQQSVALNRPVVLA